MKRRQAKHPPKQWSRAKLYRECWAAPVVSGALEDMAIKRGSLVITPTREQLTAATGITRLRTISDALTALHAAGWVKRTLVSVFEGNQQVGRLIRLVVTRKEFTTLFRKGHQTTLTAQKKRSVKGVSRKGHQTTLTASTTEGSPDDPRLSYGEGAPTNGPPPTASLGAECGRPEQKPPRKYQDGDPDWMNPKHWPSSDTEETKHGK